MRGEGFGPPGGSNIHCLPNPPILPKKPGAEGRSRLGRREADGRGSSAYRLRARLRRTRATPSPRATIAIALATSSGQRLEAGDVDSFALGGV
jgi:hypothetical protein